MGKGTGTVQGSPNPGGDKNIAKARRAGLVSPGEGRHLGGEKKRHPTTPTPGGKEPPPQPRAGKKGEPDGKREKKEVRGFLKKKRKKVFDDAKSHSGITCHHSARKEG